MRERETEPHRIRPAALNLSAFTMLDLQFVVLSFTKRLQNRPVLLSVKKLEEYRSLEFSFKHQRLLSFFRSFAIILPSVVEAEVRVRQSSVSSDTHSSTVQWRATVDMKKRRFNSNMIVFYRNWKLFPVSTAALSNTYVFTNHWWNTKRLSVQYAIHMKPPETIDQKQHKTWTTCREVSSFGFQENLLYRVNILWWNICIYNCWSVDI